MSEELSHIVGLVKQLEEVERTSDAILHEADFYEEGHCHCALCEAKQYLAWRGDFDEAISTPG